MARRWTEKDENDLVAYLDRLDEQSIATALGRTVEAVRNKRRQLGLNLRAPWEPYEDEIMRDLWDDHTGSEIAETLGRSRTSVSNRALKLGLRRRRRWEESEDRYLLMSAGDVPVEEMAEHLKRTVQSVSRRLVKNGILTQQGKRTLAEAAAILGVSVTTVTRRLKKARTNYIVANNHSGDVTDDMLVKVAKHLIAKPGARGPCNVSVRRLRDVIAEYGGDVKKKKAKKIGSGAKPDGKKTS